MQIVYLAIASLVGLAIGYLIGMAVLKSKTSAWEERLAAAKEKLESIKREATASVEAARARTQELEKRLSGVQEEATQLKKKVEEEHQAAVEAQGKLQEVETARTKAVELVEAHKAARQQAEGRLKQAETLTAQVQQELGKAQQQIQTLEKNKATVEKKAQQQAKEIERLRSAGDTAPAGESTAGLEGSVEAFANSDGTLESVLKVLMEQEGQTAAVLSDANGIIVAGAGDNGLREGMAATTKSPSPSCAPITSKMIRRMSSQAVPSCALARRWGLRPTVPASLPGGYLMAPWLTSPRSWSRSASATLLTAAPGCVDPSRRAASLAPLRAHYATR
jgi:hypothetical protein